MVLQVRLASAADDGTTIAAQHGVVLDGLGSLRLTECAVECSGCKADESIVARDRTMPKTRAQRNPAGCAMERFNPRWSSNGRLCEAGSLVAVEK